MTVTVVPDAGSGRVCPARLGRDRPRCCPSMSRQIVVACHRCQSRRGTGDCSDVWEGCGTLARDQSEDGLASDCLRWGTILGRGATIAQRRQRRSPGWIARQLKDPGLVQLWEGQIREQRSSYPLAKCRIPRILPRAARHQGPRCRSRRSTGG